MNSDGTTIVAGANNDYIYVSVNSGGTFVADTSVGSTQRWRAITISWEGTKVGLCVKINDRDAITRTPGRQNGQQTAALFL